MNCCIHKPSREDWNNQFLCIVYNIYLSLIISCMCGLNLFRPKLQRSVSCTHFSNFKQRRNEFWFLFTVMKISISLLCNDEMNEASTNEVNKFSLEVMSIVIELEKVRCFIINGNWIQLMCTTILYKTKEDNIVGGVSSFPSCWH